MCFDPQKVNALIIFLYHVSFANKSCFLFILREESILLWIVMLFIYFVRR